MKAKTLRGVIAIASATVSISAFANTTHDWFSANASANPVLVNVTTNGPVSVEDSKFVIDNDDDSPLVFTPEVKLTETNSTNISRIDVRAVMTASRTNDFKTVDNAHVGFAVGIDGSNNTNYYGYVGNSWTNLGIQAIAGTTAFSIILNYRDQDVTFIVGGNEIYGGSLSGSPTTLTRLEAFGTGDIFSITSRFEVAECAYNGTNYASVAEAIAAGGSASDIKNVEPNGEASLSADAACGLPVAVCKALGLDVSDGTANIAVAPAAVDDSTTAITLRLANDPPEAGVVKFVVTKEGGSSTSYTDASAIQIPLDAGTYTITPELK